MHFHSGHHYEQEDLLCELGVNLELEDRQADLRAG